MASKEDENSYEWICDNNEECVVERMKKEKMSWAELFAKYRWQNWAWRRIKKESVSWEQIRQKIGFGLTECYAAPQKNLLEDSKMKISEIMENGLISEEELLQILNDNRCTLIKSLSIPNEIIQSIVLYVGNGLIPISYSVDFLPFFYVVGGHKLYHDTLEKWWNEIRKNPNHRGLFYPKDINNAAKEFQQFFTKRLAENGVTWDKYCKYHRAMIPTFAFKLDKLLTHDQCKDLIHSQDITKVRFSLPTASGSSACIGGIEFMQRLYLETALHSDVFEVDLFNIKQSHGDNWCFDGNGTVLMEFGQNKLIKDLKVGDRVCSFPGNRISEIECVIVSNICAEIEMVRLANDCWITFEHPILVRCDNNIDNEMTKYAELKALHSADIGEYNLKWVLPKNEFDVVHRFQEKIFNFVLSDNHTMSVNDNWCCTLGHDLKGQVIQHEFWGDSTRIRQFLKKNCPSYPLCVFDKRMR